jgi:superfamily II DNA or RNA helicase
MKLIKKTEIQTPDVTYNLHIRDNHNYVAENIVVSNCHQCKSTVLTGIMEKTITTPYKIGFTGSLDNITSNKMTIKGLFGDINKIITARELIDRNEATDILIKCLFLKYDKESCKLYKNLKYQDEMKYLISNVKRNQFIKNLAFKLKGNTIILSNYVDNHGKVLYELIKDKVHENRKVFFVYGGTDTTDREAIRHITEGESDAIIIASFGTFSTGINIPSLENVIFASPSKSKIRNLQSIGRGLRLKDGKTKCNLFDLADDLHWKSWKNHTLNHAAERYKTYAEEEFKVKIIEVDLC